MRCVIAACSISIKPSSEGRPAGLKTLGDWKTFYEGLSSLPPQARESWLAFDHYYSDAAFPAALPLVFADQPKRLLDVGGNTGKWAVQCAKFDPRRAHHHCRPAAAAGAGAGETIRENGWKTGSISLPSTCWMNHSRFPTGYDAIWMSQFLDCFSREANRFHSATRGPGHDAGSTLYILELFWDRQPNETAAFCLQQTSLYFACIANGNSQMYHSADMLRCLDESGLE